MPNLINLTGQQFGRWTVLERSETRNRTVMWLCKCQCGTTKDVNSRALRNGQSKSCGCYQKEVTSAKFRKPFGVQAKNSLFARYKANAQNRDLEWQLSYEEFLHLTGSECFYCGSKPELVFERNARFGSYVYNGIDRVDNTRGYVPSNVVPCCKMCNYGKHTGSSQEFIDRARAIAARHPIKEALSDYRAYQAELERTYSSEEN